jgi:hypothetical protein
MKEELIFQDKEEPCEECSHKNDVTVKFPPYTKEEFDKVITLSQKYGLSNDEVTYIYNFYNRVFRTNKKPGCGKCFVTICKSLRKKYESEY